MENKIKIFESEEFGRIRTLKEESGKVVFCGSDIAKALGLILSIKLDTILKKILKAESGREVKQLY